MSASEPASAQRDLSKVPATLTWPGAMRFWTVALLLMLELSDRDRSFIAPLLMAVITATLVSRTIEERSIYDARLDDAQVAAKLAGRNQAADP